MRRTATFLITLVLVGTIALASPARADASEVVLSGTLRDATGATVANALVQFDSSQLTTGTDGTYALFVPIGTASQLTVSVPGFGQAEVGPWVGPLTATSDTFTVDSGTTRDVQLPPITHLHVHASDASADALPAATVRVYNPLDPASAAPIVSTGMLDDGTPVTFSWASSGWFGGNDACTTNDQGVCDLVGLPGWTGVPVEVAYDPAGFPAIPPVSSTLDFGGAADADAVLSTFAQLTSAGSAPGVARLSSPAGTALSDLSSTPVDDLPTGVYPLAGMLSSTISGLGLGDAADLVVQPPDVAASSSVYEREAQGGLVDITSLATFGADAVVLHLTDGGAGDVDGQANGTIVAWVIPAAVPTTASTTTLTSSDPITDLGQSTTLTAEVLPASGTGTDPTGTVHFFDGATSLGSAVLHDHTAMLPVSTLTAGTHALTAIYDGSATYLASSSDPVTQTVRTVPSAPTAIVTAWADAGAIAVSWAAPSSDGGAPVTGYTVTASPGDHTCTWAAGPLTCTVSGLTSGTPTTFAVAATNAVGTGPAGLSDPVAPSTFRDVPATRAFFADIDWLVQHQIASGYTDGTFRPTSSVTRQAMAAFLYRAQGSPNGPHPTCTKAPFTDVSAASPFCGEISWLVGTGLGNGYSDGSFRPNASVSRQAMAAFLYRASGSPSGPNPTCASAPFSDLPVTSPFCGFVSWMVSNAIASGYSDGTFRPTDSVSRQAMAAFLHRLSAIH